ncbi:MAG: hypothetical protein OQL06_06250 [Gammaproteobacteria bacterium]|nr:hypothetical protein [Gammaproteobacteria bacterium]
MKTHHKFTTVLAITCLGLLFNISVKAETGTTVAHQHHHDEHAVSSLQLNQGKKWSTDAPLREGMQSINKAAMEATTAFHHDALTKSDAEKLAQHINNTVNYLVANCKLEPQADAVLHVLIGDLLSAADTLSNQPLSSQGLPRIINTLQLYPKYFEHKDWNSIAHD